MTDEQLKASLYELCVELAHKRAFEESNLEDEEDMYQDQNIELRVYNEYTQDLFNTWFAEYLDIVGKQFHVDFF